MNIKSLPIAGKMFALKNLMQHLQTNLVIVRMKKGRRMGRVPQICIVSDKTS
jgi:hypothetical protein